MFYCKHNGKDTVVVGVYVNDLLVTGTGAAAVDLFFVSFASMSIKDPGRASKFLGMIVALDGDDGYVLDQMEAIS